MTVLTRAGMLAAICAQARSLGVAGTHGKTTTTSMLMLILAEAGMRRVSSSAATSPTSAPARSGRARSGSSSRRTRATARTSNSAARHGADERRGRPPRSLRRRSPASSTGSTATSARSPGPRWCAATIPIAAGSPPPRRDHLRHSAGVDVRAVDVTADERRVRTSRSMPRRRRIRRQSRCPSAGVHNVRQRDRRAAAMAMAVGVDRRRRRDALARFGGVARRFDIRGVDGGATFVDDYGHLPTRDRRRARCRARRVATWQRVDRGFQPNRYNRIAEIWADYADAFVDADIVVLTDIYPSGTAPIPGVTGKLLVNAVTEAHPRAAPRVAAPPGRPRRVRAERGAAGRRLHLDGMRRHRDFSDGGARCPARRAEDGLAGSDVGRAPSMRRPESRRRGERDVPIGPLTTYRVGGRGGPVRAGRVARRSALVARAVEVSGLPVLVARSGLERARRRRRASPGSSCRPASPIGSEIDVDSGRRRGPVRSVPCPSSPAKPRHAGLTGFEWAVGVRARSAVRCG